MTGSRAPQRAVVRLARLGVRADRLAAVTAPAVLLGDPLAGLTAWPLGDSALEAVLVRLEGSAIAGGGTAAEASARPARGMTARRTLGGTARARVASPPATRLASDGVSLGTRRPANVEPARLEHDTRGRNGELAGGPHVRSGELAGGPHVRRPMPEPEERARPVRPAAAATGGPARPASPTSPSALTRAAARVPGGAAALATPVAAESGVAIPDLPNAPALLQAVLARVRMQPSEATAELRLRRPRAAEAEARLPHGSALTDAHLPTATVTRTDPARSPFAREAVAEASGVAALRSRAELEDGPFAVAAGGHGLAEGPAAGRDGSGLAELVRRWERTRGSDDDPSALRPEREPGALDGLEAENALGRAVERLLSAELRRSGIEVDAG